MTEELFTQTFEDFSSNLTSTDLFLYAGAGLLLYVLFQDKLGGVKTAVADLLSKTKNVVSSLLKSKPKTSTPKDAFVDLVVSWKHTRDLAASYNCKEAVKLMDQIFPNLNPSMCKDTSTKVES